MIKAVIFNIDGVLLDSFEANLKFFSDLLRNFGHTPPTREEYTDLMGSNMRAIIKQFSKLESEEEIDKIWKAGRDKEVPYPLQLVKIPIAMQETIETLSDNFTLGLVTSRVRKSVFNVPQMASLEKFFKNVVSYEDTEKHKPYPDPLLLVAQKLDLGPEECIYVGDTDSDVVAAKAAGMKVILYSKIAHPDADANTSVFSDLPELIRVL